MDLEALQRNLASTGCVSLHGRTSEGLVSLSPQYFIDHISDLSEDVLRDQLHELFLSNEALVCVANLSYCSGLKTISLRFCGLRSIDAIRYLSKLEHINVAHNSIERIPVSTKWSCLLKCDLSFNSIARVSSIQALGSSLRLKQLNVANNPFTESNERLMIIDLLPQLCELNGEPTRPALDTVGTRPSNIPSTYVVPMANHFVRFAWPSSPNKVELDDADRGELDDRLQSLQVTSSFKQSILESTSLPVHGQVAADVDNCQSPTQQSAAHARTSHSLLSAPSTSSRRSTSGDLPFHKHHTVATQSVPNLTIPKMLERGALGARTEDDVPPDHSQGARLCTTHGLPRRQRSSQSSTAGCGSERALDDTTQINGSSGDARMCASSCMDEAVVRHIAGNEDSPSQHDGGLRAKDRGSATMRNEGLMNSRASTVNNASGTKDLLLRNPKWRCKDTLSDSGVSGEPGLESTRRGDHVSNVHAPRPPTSIMTRVRPNDARSTSTISSHRVVPVSQTDAAPNEQKLDVNRYGFHKDELVSWRPRKNPSAPPSRPSEVGTRWTPQSSATSPHVSRCYAWATRATVAGVSGSQSSFSPEYSSLSLHERTSRSASRRTAWQDIAKMRCEQQLECPTSSIDDLQQKSEVSLRQSSPVLLKNNEHLSFSSNARGGSSGSGYHPAPHVFAHHRGPISEQLHCRHDVEHYDRDGSTAPSNSPLQPYERYAPHSALKHHLGLNAEQMGTDRPSRSTHSRSTTILPEHPSRPIVEQDPPATVEHDVLQLSVAKRSSTDARYARPFTEDETAATAKHIASRSFCARRSNADDEHYAFHTKHGTSQGLTRSCVPTSSSATSIRSPKGHAFSGCHDKPPCDVSPIRPSPNARAFLMEEGYGRSRPKLSAHPPPVKQIASISHRDAAASSSATKTTFGRQAPLVRPCSSSSLIIPATEPSTYASSTMDSSVARRWQSIADASPIGSPSSVSPAMRCSARGHASLTSDVPDSHCLSEDNPPRTTHSGNAPPPPLPARDASATVRPHNPNTNSMIKQHEHFANTLRQSTASANSVRSPWVSSAGHKTVPKGHADTPGITMRGNSQMATQRGIKAAPVAATSSFTRPTSTSQRQRQAMKRLSTPSPGRLRYSWSSSQCESLGSKVARAQKLTGVKHGSLDTVLGALCTKVEKQQELLDHFRILTDSPTQASEKKSSISSSKPAVAEKRFDNEDSPDRKAKHSIIRYPRNQFGTTGIRNPSNKKMRR